MKPPPLPFGNSHKKQSIRQARARAASAHGFASVALKAVYRLEYEYNIDPRVRESIQLARDNLALALELLFAPGTETVSEAEVTRYRANTGDK